MSKLYFALILSPLDDANRAPLSIENSDGYPAVVVHLYHYPTRHPASRPLVRLYYPPPPTVQARSVDCPLRFSHNFSQTNCHTNCHTARSEATENEVNIKKAIPKDRLEKFQKKFETAFTLCMPHA